MKKKIFNYMKVVLLIVLIVLFVKVGRQSYLAVAFPFGLKELQGMEYLAVDPQPKTCSDCGDRFLYRDQETPSNCTIANIFFPDGSNSSIAKEGEYTIMLQSVDERLAWKGKKAYAFELRAYRLFEEHCWPNNATGTVIDIPGSE